jgi:hypothetical protein
MATKPGAEMQHHGLMGREARRKAEQRELKRQKTADPEAFTLATAADEAFARAIPPGWRTDWAGFESLRGEARRKLEVSWPSWCYLPWMVVTWQIQADLGATAYRDGASKAAEQKMTYLGQVMASLIPWRLGRVAVRFDPDLRAELASTVLDRAIPGSILHRLPFWSIYLATPQFDEVSGVFVSLDAACTGPRVDALGGLAQPDEVLLLFDTAEGVVASTVSFDEGSLSDCLAAQEVDLAQAGNTDWLRGNRASVARLCGRPYEEAVASVLTQVLYLCSDDADVMKGPLREVGGGRVARAAGAADGVQVWSAGYRLGAALRRARQEGAVTKADPTGRSVTPHMRASHWHLYWTGPRTEPQTPVLKLLPPTAVKFRLEDGEGTPLTVVRGARR